MNNKLGEQMINYQGVPVTIYAHSKTDATKVKVKYENHIHRSGCETLEHCGLTTVDVADLVVQSFEKKEELANAIQTSPFIFDKEGLHVNDQPVEPATVVEVTPTGTKTKSKTTKTKGASKYNVNLDVVKEKLAKGVKKSDLCKEFACPSWYLDKVIKRGY
jgi:hypothetical protein